MSRRGYPVDRYEDIERDYYREPPPPRPRSSAPHEHLDIDIDIDRRSRAPPPRTEYAPTEVREREREQRNVPDFLREDYARSTAGPLVVREEYVERDRSHPRPRERSEVEREEIKITERDRGDTRSRRGDDARSEIRSIAPSRRTELREEEFLETKSRAPEREDWMPKRSRDREIDINVRERRDDDIRSKRGSPPRSVREGAREEIVFRRGEVERRPPPREVEVEKEELVFRESKRPSPSRSRAQSVGRATDIDIDIKRREISDSRSRVAKEKVEKEEIVFRPRDRGSPPRERSIPPPPQLVGREREEIIYRRRPDPPPPPREVEKEQIVIRQHRRRSPSPVPPPAPPPPVPEEREREQIIIRQRRQRTPSPSPSPSPPPPPPARSPEPIIQPPIRQEIIREIVTHHRHIDHGFERARSPSPPPAPEPPAPKKEERREDDLEIEIRRRGTRDGKFYDEDIIFEDRRRDNASRARSESLDTHQPRSASPARTERSERRVVRGDERDDIAVEADYYNRKVSERAYMGEAWNGATKDWGIVDVPPGTRRVQMDGIGGGSQEITWQQYNGVRRGRFMTADQEYDAEFETGRKSLPPPEPEKPREEVRETRIDIRERDVPRTGGELIKRDEVYRATPPKEMWTEITKDLVTKEAIEEMGYAYEETEPFFYVMDYLKYDDVLRLVELSEDIRHQRRDRIREIQWEREEIKDRDRWELEHRPKHEPKYEDVIYEREVYEETGPRRHRYRY